MPTSFAPRPWSPAAIRTLGALALIQLGLAYVIGQGHLLTNDQGLIMAPIAVTAVVPAAIFLAAYALSTRFRGFVLPQYI